MPTFWMKAVVVVIPVLSALLCLNFFSGNDSQSHRNLTGDHRNLTAHASRDSGLTPHVPGRFTSEPPVPSGGHWQLTWDDEFNSSADLQKWSYSVGFPSWLPTTLQWFDPANAALDNGNLVMSAAHDSNVHPCPNGPCMYTSVNMSTKGIFAQAGGLFQARMKVPVEHGIWPAFWMVNADVNLGAASDSGEVDILEINGRGQPNMAGGFGHLPNANPTIKCYLGSPLPNEYHVYGVEWLPSGITWTVDGKPCGVPQPVPYSWTLAHPFYLLLTLAVGGSWPGHPDASTRFPVRMYVDWVRVYRYSK